MTAHDHREIVPGCYRCDLGRDEADAIEREQQTARNPQPAESKPAQPAGRILRAAGSETWRHRDGSVRVDHMDSRPGDYYGTEAGAAKANPEIVNPRPRTNGLSTMANTRSILWYGKGEGGEGVESGGTDSAVAPNCPSLRCSCDGCLTSRAAIRENALRGVPRPKNGPSGAWADRSWDGPLADFPGQTHADQAER